MQHKHGISWIAGGLLFSQNSEGAKRRDTIAYMEIGRNMVEADTRQGGGETISLLRRCSCDEPKERLSRRLRDDLLSLES